MFEKIFEDFSKLHVVVAGDVMLDNYRWGEVERISPEAPVPVVSIRRSESRLGGAANVALNCSALGAKVTVASVIGDDEEGRMLLQLLEEQGIGTDLVRKSDVRITTTKTRILSRNQQMVRLDTEMKEELNTRDEHAFIDATLRFLQIQKPDVLIFEDYNKGVLKENVISKIIAHCRALNILVAVDPKRDHFFAYRGVDIFKPNLKEVREGLHLPLPAIDQPEMDEVHRLLREKLQHRISFVTLSERGVYYHDENGGKIVPSHLRDIADVSGAGDTVIAVAAMVYALTRDAGLMAEWSNIAGGLVCEAVGVVPIDKQKLLGEISRLSGAGQ
ncbi:bifunctional heptose 7-phosphate kinase/heptose 1-phosphate adenyltransferase [Taibaiella koreensis]|uniref:bifunctional heptose 7-phosphate kinase/heptose 1-phosphate adenyltransferase n=1 Tax=Taibaiella koreensis TaxID=1268548 RepID=UPI000E59CA12|nr:bifunctional ADP-heptose synthase [Taibaiella koreensis]